MNEFAKPPLSVDEQLALWQRRGLHIPDPDRARRYLSVISYYRFSAYCLPFQITGDGHDFIPDVAFDDILDLYVFDRKLRLLLLDAIERIEVAFRARMTQVLSEHHGAHAYLKRGIFRSEYRHDWLLEQVENKCRQEQAEVFIKHYCSKYSNPALPPIWMVMEILTFKEVSVLFAKLRQRDDKVAISAYWGLPDAVLRSWFRALSDLRNICAHHSRTWNREFGSRPVVPRRPPQLWSDLSPLPRTGVDPTRRLYFFAVVIECLLRRINPGSSWHQRLRSLLDEHPNVSREHMGFPENWQQEPFWHF